MINGGVEYYLNKRIWKCGESKSCPAVFDAESFQASLIDRRDALIDNITLAHAARNISRADDEDRDDRGCFRFSQGQKRSLSCDSTVWRHADDPHEASLPCDAVEPYDKGQGDLTLQRPEIMCHHNRCHSLPQCSQCSPKKSVFPWSLFSSSASQTSDKLAISLLLW